MQSLPKSKYPVNIALKSFKRTSDFGGTYIY